MEVYNEKIAPQYPVLEQAARVLADSQVYVDTMTDADISPEDVAGFYEKYRERLKQMGKDEKEQEEIERLSADIETPFTYVPGFPRNPMIIWSCICFFDVYLRGYRSACVLRGVSDRC